MEEKHTSEGKPLFPICEAGLAEWFNFHRLAGQEGRLAPLRFSSSFCFVIWYNKET
jgi:hypothetical protein